MEKAATTSRMSESRTHLLEMCCHLHLAHRLEQSVAHDNGDIGTRVPVAVKRESMRYALSRTSDYL